MKTEAMRESAWLFAYLGGYDIMREGEGLVTRD